MFTNLEITLAEEPPAKLALTEALFQCPKKQTLAATLSYAVFQAAYLHYMQKALASLLQSIRLPCSRIIGVRWVLHFMTTSSLKSHCKNLVW